MTTTAVVIVAAGSGKRLGAGLPKAFAPVAGVSILEHCLRGLAWLDAAVVVVVPKGFEVRASAAAHAAGVAALVVRGGATRADSVAAGLAAASTAERVLVHDAARVLTPRAVFERVLTALEEGALAVVPTLPVVDTIRRESGVSLGAIVDRSSLRAMQTPQGFDAALLRLAYAQAGEARAASTDDAQLVQMMGETVVGVDGDESAFKITTPPDVTRAEALLGATTRVGVGVDAHAFGGSGPLRVAGLEWEGTPLAGHSDGDVVCHAIVDALLGAAGLGDIGQMAGVDDPQHAGARGTVFLELAVSLLAEHGWRPVNVSVQVVGERPRIGARREEAQSVLSAVIGAPVALAATTTDGLGALGRGEGLQAIATALIARG